MDLTPELFEKTEFAERRRGYDIEQVETFMEDAGTALAQMLARVRHTEERAAHSEARLAQVDEQVAAAQQAVEAAERRADAAERAASEARATAASAAAMDETAEVEQAAKTLLMAKRTAEATVNEARGQAQSVLEDAQLRSRQQLEHAEVEAREMLARAAAEAEAEFAERRSAALGEVQELEARRMQLSDVIAQLEGRLEQYRADLGRAASDLLEMAEDPGRLGARPSMVISSDEVVVVDEQPAEAPEPDLPGGAGSATPEATDDPAAVADVRSEPAALDPDPDPEPQGAGYVQPSAADVAAGDEDRDGDVTPQARAGAAGSGRAAATAVVEPASSEYVDLTSTVGGADPATDDRWGPGSWSEVEASLDLEGDPGGAARSGRDLDERPTEAVARAEGPRDRFLEELDSAVNEAVELDDEAMTAFFEGGGDARSRRFGWRR